LFEILRRIYDQVEMALFQKIR